MKIPFAEDLFDFFGKLFILCLSLVAIMQMVFSSDSESRWESNDFLLSKESWIPCCNLLIYWQLGSVPTLGCHGVKNITADT